MNKRRIRRYRSHNRGNYGVTILGFVGIMIVAVICGYMTARFVIAPLLGYDTEVLKLDFPSRLTDVFQDDDAADDDAADDEPDKEVNAADKTDKKETEEEDAEKDSGYALQFGLFSTRDRAEELVEKLDKEGIDAKIHEIDGQYKVLSPLVDTKDEALETLKNTESDHVDDIFITKL